MTQASTQAKHPTRVAVYGATGSVGMAALDVIRAHKERLRATILTAGSKFSELVALCLEFRPAVAVIVKDPGRAELAEARKRLLVAGCKTQIEVGVDALASAAREVEYDTLLSAITGAAGLPSNLEAARRGKRLAIANKESLVMAGGPLTAIARKSGSELLPVDSEHSAVWQCLRGESAREVRRVVLTASGGPFRTMAAADLAHVTVEQALKHPTWEMGPKITIDSATLFNKALEIIEARWLFDLRRDQLAVVVHPQSVIHSMVEFCDRSVMAQLGPTDMRIPIQLALSAPERWELGLTPMDFTKASSLTFEPLDEAKFPAVPLGFEVASTGGTAGAVFNAANEISVARFLRREIGYLDIYRTVERVLRGHELVKEPSLDEIMAADAWARAKAAE